jgi:hypothetical protein
MCTTSDDESDDEMTKKMSSVVENKFHLNENIE